MTAFWKKYFALRQRNARIAWDRAKHMKFCYAFLAPYALLFLTFYILPMLISIYYSFTYNNILEPARFIGMGNYITLILKDDVFLTAVKNTFLLAVITGPVGYIMSFCFAWLINELPRWVRTIAVVIFYAPFLSFVAGLQGVDRSQYEAGYVDGIRNRWQELYYITLPNMKPMLMFGAVMSITSAFGVCDVPMALAGFPSTDYAAHTVVTHLFDYGFTRFEMGYASAIATLLFLVMILCNKLIQSALRRIGT